MNDILVSNPKANYISYQDEIDKAIQTVLSSGWYILGKQVKSFEEEFAKYLGVSHCTGVACGTNALSIALRAVGVNPDDEVITVSHTAIATVAAIEEIGAIPVFVDVNPETFCMDESKINKVITEKTRAIVPVHIYGQPAHMEKINEIAKNNNLMIVEDCAQAVGATIDEKYVGTFGHASAFSFYPTKNLGAIGDGGAVVTNDDNIAKTVRQLREYGWNENRCCMRRGINSRLDELQAAILRVKLSHLTKDNQKRCSIAQKYIESIGDSQIIIQQGYLHSKNVYHLFVVRFKERLDLKNFIENRGIKTAFHYTLPIHLYPMYKEKIRGGKDLGETEKLYNEILTLPMYPELTDREVNRICLALKDWK